MFHFIHTSVFKPSCFKMIRAAWKEITLSNKQMYHVGTQFIIVAVSDVLMK